MSPHGLFALSRHGTYHAIRSQSNRRAAGARATCSGGTASVPFSLDKRPFVRSQKVEQMYTLVQAAINGDNLDLTLTIPVASLDAAALQRLLDLLSSAEVDAVLPAPPRRRDKS